MVYVVTKYLSPELSKGGSGLNFLMEGLHKRAKDPLIPKQRMPSQVEIPS
jgi:hypothetical protein